MAKLGHSEEEILRIIRFTRIRVDGYGGLSIAANRPRLCFSYCYF